MIEHVTTPKDDTAYGEETVIKNREQKKNWKNYQQKENPLLI